MRAIKGEKVLRGLTHTYMFCSVLASILIFASVDIAMIFYTIGASSSYIAFGIAVADAITLWLPFAIITMGWAILFPVLLFIAYIFAMKKRYQPMCILIVLDALVVVLCALYAYTSGNDYGAGLFLADAIVSVLFAAVFLLTLKTKGRFPVSSQTDEIDPK